MSGTPTIRDVHLHDDGSANAFAGGDGRERVSIEIDAAGEVTLHGATGFVTLSIVDLAALPELHTVARESRDDVARICGRAT